MEKPFKFRRVNEIAGAFVIVVLALLLTGVMVSGRLKGWFLPKEIYEVTLPEMGTMGIEPGSEVHILGNRAGSVRSVQLRDRETNERVRVDEVTPDRIKLVAVLELRSNLVAFVGKESTAILKHNLAGFGAPYLEITRGFTPRAEDDIQLNLIQDANVEDELTEAVREISKRLVPAIAQIESTSAEISTLAQTFSNPAGEFQQTVAGFNKIVGDINSGRGPAGVLLSDEKVAEELRDSLSKLNNSLTVFAKIMEQVEAGDGAAGVLIQDLDVGEDMRETIANLHQLSQRFPSTLRGTDNALDEFSDAAQSLQVALDEYRRVALALQNHWMLRKPMQKVEAEEQKQKNSPSSSKPANATQTSRSQPSTPGVPNPPKRRVRK